MIVAALMVLSPVSLRNWLSGRTPKEFQLASTSQVTAEPVVAVLTSEGVRISVNRLSSVSVEELSPAALSDAATALVTAVLVDEGTIAARQPSRAAPCIECFTKK